MIIGKSNIFNGYVRKIFTQKSKKVDRTKYIVQIAHMPFCKNTN